MNVEVVNNTSVDLTCPDGYFRVTWFEGSAWKAKVFHTSDHRLQRYLEAVEQLKYELGVYLPDEADT